MGEYLHDDLCRLPTAAKSAATTAAITLYAALASTASRDPAEPANATRGPAMRQLLSIFI